jgi:adenylate cyclase
MNAGDTQPLDQWIIAQGLEGTSETTFLDGLCARLTAGGMPLLRVNICLPTLHPVIGGHLFIWQRDRPPAVEEDWARNVAAAGRDYARTPFEYMMNTGTPRLRRRLTDSDDRVTLAMLDRFRGVGATDYFALQTMFGAAHRLGPADRVLTSWLTDATGGFAEAHLAAVEQLTPALALAIKAASTYRIATGVIETYLGKDAGQRVLGGTIERGAGETIRAALWFCDLQGFTKLSDTTPRDQLLGLMHDYFEAMVTAVDEHDGHVLKFMGDGLLAIFNTGDDGQSCRAALAAADRVIERLAGVTARRQAGGLPATRFYIGLHLGDVMYGNVGARNRLDFTVIGPAVNEVSRIEAMCRALDQDLIVSSAFAAAAGSACDRLVSLGRYVLRGVRQPQELFTLVPGEPSVARIIPPPLRGGGD